MNLLLIREKIPYGMKYFRPSAYLRHHKKLGYKALRKQKAGLTVRIQPVKLFHKCLHIWILPNRRRRFNQFFSCIPIRQIRPGQLNKEPVIIIGQILLPQILKILLPGFMLIKKLLQRGKGLHLMILRITFPKHLQSIIRIRKYHALMNRRILMKRKICILLIRIITIMLHTD